MANLNVAFVASEVAPYSKTGGLADVSGSLPKYLNRHGHNVRVFTPFYNTIDTSKYAFHFVDYLRNISIQFGNETITFSVIASKIPDSNADIYFIDCPRLYHRGSIYTDSPDEYLRFALLSRAAIECCQRMGWAPNIFHCNDWQSALIPLYLRTIYKWDNLFANTRTVLTIHNIAYQGVFPASIVDKLGLSNYRSSFEREDLQMGIVNYLKTGIFYAHLITTVSITYAREIQTSEFGSGLHSYLRKRRSSLFGIVNGVDYNEWSPEQDKLIPFNYSLNNLAGKEEDKKQLLRNMQLSYDPGAPVLGIVSRLTSQKGFDLFSDILVPVLHSYNIRLVVLGSGDDRYQNFFQNIHNRFRSKVCYYKGFQNQLAHMIEAGADIFLMPSQFEPCGLNQIYSLKYGTIPVVRKTGGLADTVQNYNPRTGEGNGFVFEHYDSQGLLWGMKTAIRTFYDKRQWYQLMRNAMTKNYSWDVQVQKYVELYYRVLSS